MSELEKELLPSEPAVPASSPEGKGQLPEGKQSFPEDQTNFTEETRTEAPSPAQAEEELQREIEYWKDQALRAAAEAENTRRRMQRELQQRLHQAQAELLSALLPLLNSLERGLQAAQTAPDLEKLQEGLTLLQRQFMQTLQRLGIERIEPEIGSPPDPELHEILSTTPSEAPPNLIVEIVEVGYRFRGQVLRPAQVIVSAA